MYRNSFILTIGYTILFSFFAFSPAKAQKDVTLDVKKPEKYENRVLGSDKTFTTKYTVPRKITQNLSTHYNFFFNANIKINNVVDGAKMSFKDDYTELLPFYNYSLDATAAHQTELDSVLMKCNAAILLHDLRNEWIDDMYLLMGKAYFYKKMFDSASITFQYINYYFQPKTEEELGFKKYIGSNLNEDGNVFTIATPEKKNIVSKIFNEPPGRNDALIWKLRTYIEDSSFSEASALIQTLKRDSVFPRRLVPSLHEMQAYYFYKNSVWDSAAYYLSQALPNAANAAEKSRWEYLVGQLYALSKNKVEAEKFFNLSIKHTVDPVMDIYARLNIIQLSQGDISEQVIEANVNQLLKMAKRDKYYNYRSIIYYMAAQMEMQRNHFDTAVALLKKGLKYNPEDQAQRNRNYLYLGDIAFDKKKYQLAASAYDSLDIGHPVVKDPELVVERKSVLQSVVKHLEVIRVEDSLQQLAAMPEAEREKLLRAAAKKLRKEKGLKDAEVMTTGSGNRNNPLANKAADNLFGSNSSKGEWYFYNNNAKSQGFTTFRNTWGTRPNVDNWRRASDVASAINAGAAANTGNPDNLPLEVEISDISYEGLLKTLPLTESAIQKSNDTIQSSLFALGKVFKDKFEDYAEAIQKYEELLNRFPGTPYEEETLFDLHYCYIRLGLPVKAKQYKELLAANFKQSIYNEYIANPKAVEESKNKLKDDATRSYENIYHLFIEGRFEEALKKKQTADSLYGTLYWPQQLLYIEAVYYIKQRQDNDAIASLQSLIQIDREAPLSKRAENVINVLKRREEIEKYLTELEITRDEDGQPVVVREEKPLPQEPVEEEVDPAPEPVAETPAPAPVKQEEPPAKQAVKEQIKPADKPKAGEITVKKPDSKPMLDSARFNKPAAPVKAASAFSYNPSEAHYVVLLLNKVDVVYVNEARNAFARYNREAFGNQPIQIAIEILDDDNKMAIMNGFEDANDAIEYMQKTKPVAGAQIVPWLAAGKYSFMVISESNLEVLKTNKQIDLYQNFFQENYPVRF